VYQQLGNTKGPSVVVKVVLAFLVPLVVFITSLAVFGRMFAGVTEAEQVQTGLSFLLALLATLACILIIRVIDRQSG
jgi:DMSO/TMAO reductase YedYZ heme-binding membrane subunit